MKSGFPWRLALVHAAICVVMSLVAATDLTWLALHLVGLSVLLAVVVLVQWMVWKIFCRWVKNRKIWVCFVFLPAVLLAADSVWWAFPLNRAVSTLDAGRLGSLPRGATDVRHYRWSGLFTGSQFVSFKASRDDVEMWIRNSPSLNDVSPTFYSADKHRIPYSTDDSKSFETKHDYFSPDVMAPAWWNETLRGAGRTYQIPAATGGHNYGILIYDEVAGVVYIKVTWS